MKKLFAALALALLISCLFAVGAMADEWVESMDGDDYYDWYGEELPDYHRDGENIEGGYSKEDVVYISRAETTYNGAVYNADVYYYSYQLKDGTSKHSYFWIHMRHVEGDCTYNQQKATSEYLKTEANCQGPAVYYMSYACRASSKGTAEEATFTSGSTNSDRHPQDKLSYSDPGDPVHSHLASASHTWACSGCGESGTEAHDFEAIGDFQCNISVWYRVYKCSQCGAIMYKESGSTPDESQLREVVLSRTPGKAATCTQMGMMDKWQCTLCGEEFEDEAGTIAATNDTEDPGKPALGHLIVDAAENLVKMNGHFPEGYMHPIRCARENCDETSPYVNYYYEYVPCTPGEWQQDEKEHYAICTVCEQLCAQEEHTFGKGVVTLMPDCWSEGRVEYTCAGCGYVKSETLPSLGHWFEDYEVKSTCTGAGYTAKKCIRCGLIVGKEKVDAAGHTPGEWQTLTAATCTEKGEEIVKCTACDVLLDTRETDALGHAWGEWIVATPATTEQEGLEKRVCANDASHVETRALEKLQPTDEPSTEPSAQPTEEPSTEPTAEPTVEPTAEPSTEPTAQPTQKPSADGSTDIPKTGDSRHTGAAFLMMAISLAGLCALALTRRQRVK